MATTKRMRGRLNLNPGEKLSKHEVDRSCELPPHFIVPSRLSAHKEHLKPGALFFVVEPMRLTSDSLLSPASYEFALLERAYTMEDAFVKKGSFVVYVCQHRMKARPSRSSTKQVTVPTHVFIGDAGKFIVTDSSCIVPVCSAPEAVVSGTEA